MKEKGAVISKKNKKIQSALLKRAVGYDLTESVEEFVYSDEGEYKLTKKKVTTKNVPPDLDALKILMNNNEQSVESMTNEELLEERERLIKSLSDSQKKVKGE
ncbi:MAG: hypothetical protein MJ066_05140 [Clostridia bacterium]|nr:hypothetical protein [Clostridia bacterium]